MVQTRLGPTLAPDDLADTKTLALFGRAESRDFCDVYQLAGTYSTGELEQLATERDRGFSRPVLAQMIDMLGGISDADLAESLPHEDLAAMRRFYTQWADILRDGNA